jgi:hypothetical protein
MKAKIVIAFTVLTVFLFAPSRDSAQDNTQQKAKRLTGCILRGDITDNYKFITKDGIVWNIAKTNKLVKIDPYVGHTVTVVGSLTPNPYSAKDDPNAGTIKRDLSKNNAGVLDISKITKKGATCNQ